MFEKYFKFPVRADFSYIFDSNNNMVANILADLTSASTNHLLSILNGDDIKVTVPHVYRLSDDKSTILCDEVGLLLIRGWGMLTGIGGFNLSFEVAKQVQDELAEHLLKLLIESQTSIEN